MKNAVINKNISHFVRKKRKKRKVNWSDVCNPLNLQCRLWSFLLIR